MFMLWLFPFPNNMKYELFSEFIQITFIIPLISNVFNSLKSSFPSFFVSYVMVLFFLSVIFNINNMVKPQFTFLSSFYSYLIKYDNFNALYSLPNFLHNLLCISYIFTLSQLLDFHSIL